jgi:hypothetical protein
MRYSYLRASTGSSCAAFTAGHTPKNTPITTDTVNPVISAHVGTLDGSDQCSHQQRDQYRDHDAQNAARAGERHGFHQKLPDDVPAARADGLPHADLARALGHAHQHDVHHPDAAHQQAKAGDRDRHQADQAGDLIELLDDLIGRGDGEIVRCIGADLADAAHHRLHLVESVLPLAR